MPMGIRIRFWARRREDDRDLRIPNAQRNHPMLQGKEGVAYEGLGFVLLPSEIHAGCK